MPRNDRPIAGGTDRDGKVVTAEDIAKLKEQLQNRAREQALAELYARAGGDRSLVSRASGSGPTARRSIRAWMPRPTR